VNTESLQDQQALRAELDEARSRLDGLVRELHVIDDMLEELSPERQHYALVQEACGALEKLSELGGAELFWGDRPADGDGDSHIGMVRRRVDEFERRLSDIERSRQSLLDRIRRQQENTEYLEDDLDHAQRREELRKLEWVVEREIGPLPDCEPVMPWSRGGEDDQRFRKSLATSLLLALLVALVVPMIDLPVPERWEVIEVPERLTRLIKEEMPLPPSPLQQELTSEEKLPDAPDEEPVLAEESTPEPTPEPKAEQSAGSKGILALVHRHASIARVRPRSAGRDVRWSLPRRPGRVEASSWLR
jgi:hypothetical protein